MAHGVFMELNLIGLASAIATFFGVWLGHISVRKIEREVERIWIPSTVSLLLGIGLDLTSIWTLSRNLSTICGIVGVTLLWDSLEFYRQERRITKGHAPANRNNPRHARILRVHPSATAFDWLARDPRGIPYTSEELDSMKERTA
jgi:hypothetical protein